MTSIFGMWLHMHFGRHFYPKQLTPYSRYIFYHFLHYLGIELTVMALGGHTVLQGVSKPAHVGPRYCRVLL